MPRPLVSPREQRLVVLSFGMIVAAYAPLLSSQALHLWALPAFRFFPLALAAGAWLALVRVRKGMRDEGGWLASLVVMSLLLLAIGIAVHSGALATVSALVFAGACAVRIGGARLFRQLLPIWLLFWMFVGLPLNADTMLLERAHEGALGMALAILDRLGVTYAVLDDAVHVPGHRLFTSDWVREPWFLLAASALSVLYCTWRKRSLLATGVVMLWTALWAWTADVVRIAATIGIAERWEDLGDTPALGVLISIPLLAIVAWLAWNLDELIAFRVHYVRLRRRAEDSSIEMAGPTKLRTHIGLTLSADGTLQRTESDPKRRISKSTWSTLAIASAFGFLLAVQVVMTIANFVSLDAHTFTNLSSAENQTLAVPTHRSSHLNPPEMPR
ncbi:MAG TPA: archaeosortase/exosortase family protein [Pirellulales bacterium]|nr:archaeosortase/exosortase family protein [Pirellulales bacterium]